MDEKAPRGTQSIERAVAVLRAAAGQGEAGITVAEVATELGLNVTTAYRLLTALTEERLLERDPVRKRYRIGPEVHALSARGASGFSFTAHFDRALSSLAEETGDTVMLSVRRGSQSLCLARKEGAFPIRTMTLQAGSWRPLGVGGGSLALLAFLPAEEREEMLATNAAAYLPFGLDRGTVETMIERSRRLGYALNDGRVLRDLTAVAVPVRTEAGRVVAAISVAAINSRMTAARRSEVVAAIRREIGNLGPLPG